MWDREPGWRRGPPGWDVIDRTDLLVWSGPLPERTTNEVVFARWSGADAQRGIPEAIEFFASLGVSEFEWVVGPTSRPADLGARLEQAGLRREDDARMMVGALPLPAFRANTEVSIVESVDLAAIRDFLPIAHPDWAKERIEREVPERLEYVALPGRRGGYLVAYLDGEPVANATWKDSSDGHCVYLKGAGTREGFRRRGIYAALTAYRCDRAFERGCRYASIIAMAETSAPILRSRGFSDLGPLPRYVWSRSEGTITTGSHPDELDWGAWRGHAQGGRASAQEKEEGITKADGPPPTTNAS